MHRFLFFLAFFTACNNNKPDQRIHDALPNNPDSSTTEIRVTKPRYDLLRQDFLNADSVILLSHHSPNMPIKNPRTRKYYEKTIPFIVQDTINYETSVQERKQLNQIETEALLAILTLPAVDDRPASLCFQPRNAVVIFKDKRMSCFDFCFDCSGFVTYGSFSSVLVMNTEKYKKLMALYKRYRFKYELY